METSLKLTINRMMLVTLFLVSIVTAAFVFCYSQVKQTLANKSLLEALERNSSSQIQTLLPSFLLPEQKLGIPILLDRFRTQDDLEHIQFIENRQSIPYGFSSCFKDPLSRSCISDDKKRVAALFPIHEGSREFGYLFKVRKIENPFINDHILLVVEVGAGVLVLSFLLLFLFMGRLTSHEIPTEISNLLSWLEGVLREQTPTKMPHLKFQELNELGRKAAELIERQNKIRDQALIGQLTSGIMHDIRTPFQSIVAAVYLAQEQPIDSPKRNARLENLLGICLNKLPVIGKLIESTLDVNRNIHIESQPRDLQETLCRAVALNSDLARKMGAKIEIDEQGGPVIVKHDQTQLSRVFLNIVKNAIEAPHSSGMPSGNRVNISIIKTNDDLVKVIFEDSGPGLPENVESIFRVFRSSKPRGSGLGLVISKKIVESHHGKLIAGRAQSLSGARFEVILPVCQ